MIPSTHGTPFGGVVFDWRGTLVSELSARGWAGTALRRIGREAGEDAVTRLLRDIRRAAGEPNRLKSPQGNISFERHRQTYFEVFHDAELDDDLAQALFDVDSSTEHNLFAVDAAETLRTLRENGCRIGVLSNIHFDIAPEFAEAGLDGLVDEFVLSSKEGVQKPDPAIFELMLTRLGTSAEHTLMVGDRSSRDGAAADIGMPTLLIPPLRDHTKRQLHLVTNLAGLTPPPGN
ncbi:HAD family hydrolase [Nocardia sp. NPDC048505]|uniref:HAD family hydrolase n=1 Tax=unclassified Nocardia TaxID=2637762 RepID=UPI0033CD08CF